MRPVTASLLTTRREKGEM